MFVNSKYLEFRVEKILFKSQAQRAIICLINVSE